MVHPGSPAGLSTPARAGAGVVTALWLSVWLGSSGTAQTPEAPRLLATGQGFGYAANVSQPADGNADDGDLIRGRPLRYEHADTARPATADENVVLDANTGLMWIRSLSIVDGSDPDGVAGNVNLAVARPWQSALDAARALDYAGYRDWRLPNIHELSTLAHFGYGNPALDPDAFPEPLDGLASPYQWSSTTHAGVPVEAFYMNALDGHAYPWHKAVSFSVRPVREARAVADPVAVMTTGQVQGYAGDAGAPGQGNGDDGDLRRGLPPHFEFSDDGRIDTEAENVAQDLNTGLQWIRDPSLLTGDAAAPDEGGVAGNVPLAQPLDWQAAVAGCANLEYGGHADWTLPNIRELDSITQFGRPGGTLDPAVFPPAAPSPNPSDPTVWWSSTTAVVDRPGEPGKDAAWYITADGPPKRHSVGAGHQPAKARPGLARCVRDSRPVPPPDLYLAQVRSSTDFSALTVEGTGTRLREGKFLLAATDAADVPFQAAFQDVHRVAMHMDFLLAAFPERFGGMSPTEYAAITAYRATRTLYAGSISSFTAADGDRWYGFDVYTADGQPAELLSAGETRAVYRRLAAHFLRRPLAYSPARADARQAALGWVEPGFPVLWPAATELGYEAYTQGLAYGTVKVLGADDLRLAVESGRLSRRDIVVVDQAPADLEAVVAAIVTGEPQAELSHLAVRAARRGTPNAYVSGAGVAVGAWTGRLVRIVVAQDGYTVAAASPAEAEAFWASSGPAPVAVAAPDLGFDDLPSVAGGAAGRSDQVGGKAANLTALYSFLPARYQVPGFAIPFRWYDAFLRTATTADPGGGPDPVTLGRAVELLHADARFRTDPAVRAAGLEALRAGFRQPERVARSDVERLAARIHAVFGPRTMVRFRSSSNAEDSLEFTGAGLYDSTSVCAEDSLDADSRGPSHCNPGEPEERTIERGLTRVWASLWNFRAWDERDYFGIDHARTAMAVLVTTAFPDERANGVAFTGNPASPDAREFVVNVQLGDTSVVHPDPGILPERDAILVDDGAVAGVRRQRPSTLMPAGEWVMSEPELAELGAVMLSARREFPVELGGRDPRTVLLDMEFKLRKGDDALLIKQVRPFAVAGDWAAARDRLYLDVEPNLALCALWRPSLPIRQEYDDKAVLSLSGALHTIDLTAADGEVALFDRLALGPQAREAVPVGAGSVAVTPEPGRPGLLRVTLARRYASAGRTVEVRTTFLDVRAGEVNARRLDAGSMVNDLSVTLDDGRQAPQGMAPCGLASLPRQRVSFTLAGGQAAQFDLRKGGGLWSYQPADIQQASVRVRPSADASPVTVVVTGYHNLVYDAERHNWNETFWALFSQPVGDTHGLSITQQGTGTGDGTYQAAWLGRDLESLRTEAVLAVTVRDDSPRRIFVPAAPNAGD